MIKVQKRWVESANHTKILTNPRQGHPLVRHSSVPIRALTFNSHQAVWGHLVWKTSETKNPGWEIGERWNRRLSGAPCQWWSRNMEQMLMITPINENGRMMSRTLACKLDMAESIGLVVWTTNPWTAGQAKNLHRQEVCRYPNTSWEGTWTPQTCLKHSKTPSQKVFGCLKAV